MGGGSSSYSRRWGRPCCENIAPRILRKPVPQCGLGAHSPKNRDPNPSGIGRGRPRSGECVGPLQDVLIFGPAAAGPSDTAALRAKIRRGERRLHCRGSCCAGRAAGRPSRSRSPFLRAKPARLLLPRLRGRPPHADFGRKRRAQRGWVLLLCGAAAAGDKPVQRQRCENLMRRFQDSLVILRRGRCQ
jgi:hypothetical protein